MNHLESKFQHTLKRWHRDDNNRQMPWKGIQDTYKVWLSEIILQQTRVEQGWKYYEAFISNFPTVYDLASAEEDEVLRLWQGLGYYSRARNLHFTAKDIVNNYSGTFPNSFDALLKLKGVGKYTAAAIASFVFKEKVAVVDGNVIRVLSRFFSIDTPFDTSIGKRQFEEKAQEVLDNENPDKHNQAIMDFGATICKPKNPQCQNCPLATGCRAYQENSISRLPVKKNRIQSKSRYFYAFHIEDEDGIAIEQRKGKDIWQGLYQLPWKEVEDYTTNKDKQIDQVLQEFSSGEDLNFSDYSEMHVQQLSHQKIHVIFVQAKAPKTFKNKHKFIYTRNLTKFAFPKIFILYLRGKSLILE